MRSRHRFNTGLNGVIISAAISVGFWLLVTVVLVFLTGCAGKARCTTDIECCTQAGDC